jgi:hypothetical protein
MKLNDSRTLELTKVGGEIDKELGCKMVKDFQDSQPEEVKSYFIGREIIERILNQPNCVGIKFYNALNELGQKTLVYVGLDQNEEIIYEITYVSDSGKLEKRPGIVADRVEPADKDPGDGWLTLWV